VAVRGSDHLEIGEVKEVAAATATHGCTARGLHPCRVTPRPEDVRTGRKGWALRCLPRAEGGW